MIKKTLLILLTVTLFISCSSVSSMINADSNIRKVELGMSKKKVIDIMGKSYRAVGAIHTPEGDVEIIGYENAEEGMYKMHILNDKLVQWEYEKPRPSRKHHNTN